jgi:hypothetical protein
MMNYENGFFTMMMKLDDIKEELKSCHPFTNNVSIQL